MNFLLAVLYTLVALFMAYGFARHGGTHVLLVWLWMIVVATMAQFQLVFAILNLGERT